MLSHVEIFQLNLGKRKIANEEIILKLSNCKNNYIVLGQEPYTYAREWCGIPKTIRKHTPTAVNFRTGILHSPDLYIYNVPEFTSRDITTCIWKTKNPTRPEIYLLSVYWDGTVDAPPIEFRQALDFFQNNRKEFIIGIDTNAHSQLWGYRHSDRRGEIFEDIILAYNLSVLNQGTRNTFETSRGQSIIDISISSPNVLDSCSQWQVLQEHSGSDHKLIRFIIETEIAPPPLKQNLSKCNWTLVHQELAQYPLITHSNWSQELIDIETNKLTNFIMEIIDQKCPPKPSKFKIKISGWDESAHKSRAEVRKAWRRVQRHLTEDNWRTYKHLKKKHTKLVRKLKRNEWKKYSSDVPNTKQAAKLNKIIQKKFNTRQIGILRREDGQSTQTIDETAELLMETHFPGCRNPTEYSPSSEVHDNPPLNWITPDRIRKAIYAFQKTKSPGPDRIQPIILKNLPNNIIENLCKIFTACINLKYTPKIWKQATVVFIPKLGKDDYADPRAYRPISLTSFVFKTLERLTLWHVEETVPNRIHKNQHAFRKGHSSEIALNKVVNKIEKALNDKMCCIGIFLDIEGAYDNISSEALIRSMRKHKLPKEVIDWFEQYLQYRKCQFTLGGETYVKETTTGVTQGGGFKPPFLQFPHE
jgi:hypothetical protein